MELVGDDVEGGGKVCELFCSGLTQSLSPLSIVFGKWFLKSL